MGVSDDFALGDELCPINAKPPGYVMNGLIAAGDWITTALDLPGYRMGDVKGMAVEAGARSAPSIGNMVSRDLPRSGSTLNRLAGTPSG